MKKFQNLMNIDKVEIICDNKQNELKGGGFEEGCPPPVTDSGFKI